MTNQKNGTTGFWSSIPGFVTKLSGLIVAIGSIVTVFQQVGWIPGIKGKTDDDKIVNSKIIDVCQSEESCYIVCDSAFGTREDAANPLVRLRDYGYNNKAAYLWRILDYEYGSGAKKFQVFIGPYVENRKLHRRLV